MYLRPASSYAFPVVSSRFASVYFSMNRLISPGAIGLVFKSISCSGIRRSLKNRSAARVALELFTPKICTICIWFDCDKLSD